MQLLFLFNTYYILGYRLRDLFRRYVQEHTEITLMCLGFNQNASFTKGRGLWGHVP